MLTQNLSHFAAEMVAIFVNHSFVTLHIDNIAGENAHHQCESIFKSFALSIRSAVQVNKDAKLKSVPSTKGVL